MFEEIYGNINKKSINKFLKTALILVIALIACSLSVSFFKRYKINLKQNDNGQNFFDGMVFGDIKIHLNNDLFSHDVINEENYNNEAVLYLNKNLRKGDTVINIGHNVGIQTLLMAKLVQQSGRVYFFNPSKKYVDAIRSSAQANGFENRILASALGMSDHSFDGLLVHRNNFPDMTGKIQRNDYEIPAGHSTVTIKVSSIDEQLPGLQNVNLMEINVNEDCSRIIKGAINVIKRSKQISIIVRYDRTHFSDRSVFERLSNLGFKPHVIQSDGSLKPSNIDELQKLDRCFVLFKIS